MRSLNLTTLVLTILGGVNWGLIGALQFNLVAWLFGPMSMLTQLVYIVVGCAALYQVYPLMQAVTGGVRCAEAGKVR